jgi:hypothetical protein
LLLLLLLVVVAVVAVVVVVAAAAVVAALAPAVVGLRKSQYPIKLTMAKTMAVQLLVASSSIITSSAAEVGILWIMESE